MIELTRQVPVAAHVTAPRRRPRRRHPPRAATARPESVRRYVRFGASPRGAQALVLAAKAAALLDGRPNVAADDIRAVAVPRPPPPARARLRGGRRRRRPPTSSSPTCSPPSPTRPPASGARRDHGSRFARVEPDADELHVELLPPDLLGRLERLQLGTRRRLAGTLRRRAPVAAPRQRPSTSPTTASTTRATTSAASTTSLWARLDQLLVRLFEAEDDLTVRLLVDTSASMAGAEAATRPPASPPPSASSPSCGATSVTVHTFPLDRPAPRFTGRHATHALFGLLGDLEADGDTRFAARRHRPARPGPARRR